MLSVYDNNNYALLIIKGAGNVRPFHATDLRAPEGTGNLAIKIPKGTNYFFFLISNNTIILGVSFSVHFRCQELLHSSHALCVCPAPGEGRCPRLTAGEERQRLCNSTRVGGRVEPVWPVLETVRGGL